MYPFCVCSINEHSFLLTYLLTKKTSSFVHTTNSVLFFIAPYWMEMSETFRFAVAFDPFILRQG